MKLARQGVFIRVTAENCCCGRIVSKLWNLFNLMNHQPMLSFDT